MAPKQLNLDSMRGEARSPAFTIVELLVSIGVIVVLLALAMPALRSARERARVIGDLNKVRGIAASVMIYANDSKDSVPTIFLPVYLNVVLGDPWQQVEVGGTAVRGAWFTNGYKYHYLLGPLPQSVMTARGAPKDSYAVRVFGAKTAFAADFALSHTFYADPEFWTIEKQAGPKQWAIQPISSVAYPSMKGMIYQRIHYPSGGAQNGETVGASDPTLIVVAWSDGSASEETMNKLIGGVPNNWHHGLGVPISSNSRGEPIANTEFGILGRDR